MIARLWYGWTTRDNAQEYERMLREEVLLDIAKKAIPGYKGAELFVRDAENDEVEFVTLLRFETLDAAKIFAGKNYETPVIPPQCKKVLKRCNEKSRHYQVVPLN
ncbi:MAG TPA: hypothetical protein VH170_08090 [Chthoniobacterales bacterium]|jgi:heme-degrading monooxygenase HmoA|nr:hypothetical protein [Chthoniobacterales bacterium]